MRVNSYRSRTARRHGSRLLRVSGALVATAALLALGLTAWSPVDAAPGTADLALAKTVSDATPNVGDTVTFTVTLSDAGPDSGTNVMVQDVLPAGLALVSAAPSQGTYTAATGAWNVGTVAVGTPQTLQLQATVVSPVPQTNTATVSNADEVDPNVANNSASATETPQQADLALTKAVSNPFPNVGDTITFTVTLSNSGPDAATNVTVADLLPAGLTFVSATSSQGTYDSATGGWTVGTVTTATPQTLQVQATVAGPAPQTNIAAVSHADQFDPNTANNSASATDTPPADLALAKVVSDATPNVGDTVTFTVTLSNLGPNPATSVTVTDLLPAGLAFVSATPSQGTYTTATGLWNVGTVVGAPQTLQLQAIVTSPSPQTNTASVSHSDQFDPSVANNSASATETPQQAEVVVTKSVSNPFPNVGDTVTFTVTVTDAGPDPATNVTVQDLLPAGLTFVSATTSQGAYNSATGTWTLGTVTVGPPQTLQLTALVASPASQTNTASVSHSDQFDPNTANNSASATVATPADLALSKSVSNATPNVGDTVFFTVTSSDGGPNPATNVTVQDLLPAGLALISATPSQGTYTAATGLWNIGTVTVGTPQTLQLQATVVSPVPQTNTATVTHSDEFDPDITNNSASATVTPLQADVALTKTVSNASANVGDPVTFTVTASDAGPDAATNVSVQDLLPAGLTFVSATPSQGTYDATTGVWTIGTLSTATPQTLQVQATVASSAPQTNTAAVSHADEFDPNPGDNSASATVTPGGTPLTTTTTTPAATSTTTIAPTSTTSTPPTSSTPTTAPALGQLPRTGTNVGVAVVGGVMLLGLGLALSRRVRRHRGSERGIRA